MKNNNGKERIMKIVFSITILAMVLPLSTVAQDDMYYIPSKSKVSRKVNNYSGTNATFYSGSDRNVDEYNRHGSYVLEIDSAGNDIIDFDAVVGVYPDTMYVETGEDYSCTRKMSRFDDYYWDDSYWVGFHAGRYSSWWYDPWYYSSWYYSPWYYGWYDPWFYGGYAWHSHWWGYPHYVVAHKGGISGTRNPVRVTGRPRGTGFAGTRSVVNGVSSRSRAAATASNRTNLGNSVRFGSTRNSVSSYSNVSRQNSGSFSQGSFGGSRSGGSFGGGSRSGGSRSGGGFGGRR